MTSEEQLILFLGRGQFPSDARRRALSLLALPLDWDLIVDRVLAEGVDPLFFRNLEWVRRYSVHSVCCDGPETLQPENPNNDINATNAINAIDAINATNAINALKKLAKINAFRNTLLVEELVRVLKLLSEAGIPAIPLKGPALAQQLYDDPSLRTCGDLDILVPRSMVGRAVNLLRAEGYTSEFSSGFFANLLLRHDIEYALRRDGPGFPLMIELHWGVLWGGKAEENIADRIWADAYPTTIFGAPAYALSAEWQILVLAAHAARHHWRALKWLVDLDELYSSSDVDWDKLDRKAKEVGWEEFLRISFLACHRLFETPILEKYLVGELPDWVKLFPSSSPDQNDAFFPVRLMQSPLDKLRYAARVLLIPTLAELRLVALPSFLAFLYYPLRPLRLLCKWGWAGVAKGKGVRAKCKEWPAAA
jgi:putative nucleotidyltransferase-like protein